ncbi:MAG: hypothetical protein ACJAS4_002451 [Bacteriovoracaceae bacterium]|jgi:hypothetical protein
MPEWSYDAGPDPKTKMGKELIDITANIPNMPELSKKIMGRSQKFRPAFGPIPWRMRQEENKVKILFMGQDGTHIAEAAGRPATAGFGGRAQDLANYFGVNEGAAFINAYSFTIKGQYGIYNTPYIYQNNNGPTVRMANLVSNELWAMSNSLKSPVTKWRNNLIDWIIRNNKKSMKLIVLFGGAARDAIASYAKSKGAKVYGRMESEMSSIQVPQTKSEYAGGNNTFPSLVARDGKDLYSKIIGRKLTYKNIKDQKTAVKSLKEQFPEYLEKMVFTKGGEHQNGLLNSAQLGGYDLDSMLVNGVQTRSLKGLKLNDGSIIENDIIVISLPHPSSLSRTVMDAETYFDGKEAASARVMRDVKKLDTFSEKGWIIEPDLNKTNFYAQGKNYNYGRSDIGPEFYDFGTPANRMVSKSTAKRMRGNSNVVIIGTRDDGKFSKAKISEMSEAMPAFGINPENLFIARPRTMDERYSFDPGPGEEIAKLMITSLDYKKIYTPKEGMTFKQNGIAAFNIKSHPSVSDFGHYRGTFKNPKVLIIADPQGYDDIVTARALTGSRGQYLHSLMKDLYVDDQYLVIKTVPFAMDGANEEEWQTTLNATKNYRKALLNKIFESNTPKLVISDGPYATQSAQILLKGIDIPLVSIKRKPMYHDFGIASAGSEIVKLGLLSKVNAEIEIRPRMENIPRSHLSFYSRIWEGTSGDRAITSKGILYEGLAFAEVVPNWAFKQKSHLSEKSESEVSDLIELLREENLPLPYESIPQYLRRVNSDPSITFMNLFYNWGLNQAS